MGRKPNQLVLEYFDRGPRLTDNSNRYEQRCKACGENFPKGRTENLIIHIESKCPAIRRENPTRLQAQAYSTPPSTADGEGSVQGSIGHVDNSNDSTGLHAVLPVSTRRSLTGLEALAEASRQLTRPGNQGAELPPPRHHIDPHLENAHSDLDNGPRRDDHYHAYYAAATEASGPTSHLTMPELSAGFNDPRDYATLSRIASSASTLEAMMPQDQTTQRVEEPSDSSQESSFQPLAASALQTGGLEDTRLTAMRATGRSQAPGSGSSSNPPALQDSGQVNRSRNPSRASGKSHGRNQKIRGKFTDSRRQEVQNIRKKGACIRCRMLRKTCSGESPCKACASVLSARVWKLDCVRTNIHKELDIFQTGIFGILASRHRDRWRSMELPEPVECFARFSHAERDVAPIEFAARIDLRQHVGQEAGVSEQYSTAPPGSIPFLEDPIEQVSAKLLSHMLAAIFHPTYTITSPLIGPTITAALDLTQQGDLAPGVDTSPIIELAPKTGTQDRLLTLSLDLWALTQVIVSEPNDWRISLTASNISSENPSTQPNSASTSGLEHPASAGVLSQLKAAAEQRAALISRNVMIELEKRLERKEKCQGFETFLVGVVLLNCVERVGWAMKRMSIDEQQWPLDQSIHHYLHQSAHFADFLSKLYRMRGILLHLRRPKPKNPNNPNPENDADDDAILQPMVEDGAIVRWLRELRLTGNVLEEIHTAAGAGFEAEGGVGVGVGVGVEEWDFQFCGLLMVVAEEESP